jgi:hypothetical protein
LAVDNFNWDGNMGDVTRDDNLIIDIFGEVLKIIEEVKFQRLSGLELSFSTFDKKSLLFRLFDLELYFIGMEIGYR